MVLGGFARTDLTLFSMRLYMSYARLKCDVMCFGVFFETNDELARCWRIVLLARAPIHVYSRYGRKQFHAQCDTHIRDIKKNQKMHARGLRDIW